MTDFMPISSADPVAEVIREAFDMSLAVSGGWGYSCAQALILHTHTMPRNQLQHTLASMRTHLEMSMTRPAAERYGGINLTEVSRRREADCEQVTYRITAMLESDYATFIQAYKEGYGQESFDMEAHFAARKEATLERTVTVYFRDQMESEG